MKNLVFVIIFLFVATFGKCQDKYWVYLIDKAQFNLEEIKKGFSEEGLLRRATFSIEFDGKDIPVKAQYKNQLNQFNGVKVIGASKWFNAVVVVLEREEIKVQLEQLDFVKSVVKLKSAKNLKTINKNKLATNFTLKQVSNIAEAFYGESYAQTNLINLIPLHTEGFFGGGIKIGVFDAGFFGADTLGCFEKLRNENRILGTFDLVDQDNTVYDKHTHGTYVLSCISAFQEGLLIGTAPEASVYLFRTEDGATETQIEEYNWVKAAEMADSLGIHIINSSLGYTLFDDSIENHAYSDMDGNTTIITKGADIAASKGILVVNSAGNSGTQGWKFISAPADGDSVFSIGAVNPEGDVADFSSYGPSYDGRVKPNICGVGWETAVCSFDNKVAFLNGTSFSSPLTAGAMATLWSKYPMAHNMDLMKYVEQSADRYTNPDDRCGYGIPDFGSTSNILSAIFPTLEAGKLSVYPNPSNGLINLNFTTDTQTAGQLNVFDIMGRLIFSNTFNARQGNNYNQFELLSLKSGIYHIRLELGSEVLTQKLILKSNFLSE